MSGSIVKVLLVEDDEEDVLIIQHMLSEVHRNQFQKFLIRISERGLQPNELIGQSRLFWERFARQAILDRRLVIIPEVHKYLESSTTILIPCGSFFKPCTGNEPVQGCRRVLERRRKERAGTSR